MFIDETDPIGPDGIWATADDGLRLGPNSDALNAGDNAACTTYSITEDITGTVRIQNGTVDMGAYEHYADSCVILTTVYVDSSATGDNTGCSWEHAFTDLQDALAILASHPWVDTIKVAKGSYYPTPNNSSHVFFIMRNGIAVFGGYPSGGGPEGSRDWLVHPTRLSGYIGQQNGTQSRAYSVVAYYSADTNTILDGFIIEGAYNVHSSGIAGGGIFMWGASYRPIYAQIRNCLVRNNYIKHNNINSKWVESGAGCTMYHHCYPTFKNVTFENNHVQDGSGGAVAMFGRCEPLFMNCTFLNNSSDINGGAVTVTFGGPKFTDCHFEGNQSASGGAVFTDSSSVATFMDCSFDMNTAEMGGAIYCDMVRTQIIENSFKENTAVEGGVLYLKNKCYPTILSSVFDRNVSESNGGVLWSQNASYVDIAGSVFNDNIGGEHGGVIFATDLGTTVHVSNSTLFSNNSNGLGGAFYIENKAGIASYNCIFRNNDDGSASQDADQEVYLATEGKFFAYNSMFDLYPADPIYNNRVGENPLLADENDPDGPNNDFFDPQAGLRIGSSASRAVNGGNNAFCASGVGFDIASGFRKQKGVVDLGAYESAFGVEPGIFPKEDDDLQLFQGCKELPVLMEANLGDFGFIDPTGINNSTDAFLLAAEWLRNNSSPGYRIKLNIPSGNYLVGVQIPPGTNYNAGGVSYTNPPGGATLMGIPIFDLQDVQNATIEGQGSVSIQFDGNMYYGGWAWNGGQLQWSYDIGNKYATPGILFKMDNCNCVEVKNLEADGNVDEMAANGHIGGASGGPGNGIQKDYDAFFVFGSKNIAVSNVNAHHFGRDGVYLSDQYPHLSHDLLLVDSKFNYNGRGGFSWVGGDTVRSLNTQFNYNGNGGYQNNPGAGFNIESTTGCVTNGYWKNCEFMINARHDFVQNLQGVPYWLSGEMEFDNCTFWGKDYVAIWANRIRNTRFLNCRIYGALHSVCGTSPLDPIVFEDCFISDVGPDGQGVFPYINSIGWSNLLTLVSNSSGSANTDPAYVSELYFRFSNCTFENRRLRLFWGSGHGLRGEHYYSNTWECNTFNVFTNDIFESDLPTLTYYPIGILFVNDLQNSYFYSNTFIDRTPFHSVLGTPGPANNSLFFEVYLNNNKSDGNNRILPSQKGNVNNRLTRQHSASNWSNSKAPF